MTQTKNKNINSKKMNEIDYQFTATPTNLMMCCDNNIRSMLFAMIQLSTYYANNEGWFFRANADLQAETNLSENLVRATLSELYNQGIILVRTVGERNGAIPNFFKVNFEKFDEWKDISIEDAMKNPLYKILTPNYKDKGWKPAYVGAEDMEIEEQSLFQKSKQEIMESEMSDEVEHDCDDIEQGYDGIEKDERNSNPQVVPNQFPNVGKSEHNIDNIENIENKNNSNYNSMSNSITENSNSKENINSDKSQTDEYRKEEDYLMDKLYHVQNWTDFCLYREKIGDLISIAQSETDKERTMKRYNIIKKGKLKYLVKVYENLPYTSMLEGFYKETGCGWKGKSSMSVTDKTEMSLQSISSKREEEMRQDTTVRSGSDSQVMRQRSIQEESEVPNKYQAVYYDDDDDLPF